MKPRLFCLIAGAVLTTSVAFADTSDNLPKVLRVPQATGASCASLQRQFDQSIVAHESGRGGIAVHAEERLADDERPPPGVGAAEEVLQGGEVEVRVDVPAAPGAKEGTAGAPVASRFDRPPVGSQPSSAKTVLWKMY